MRIELCSEFIYKLWRHYAEQIGPCGRPKTRSFGEGKLGFHCPADSWLFFKYSHLQTMPRQNYRRRQSIMACAEDQDVSYILRHMYSCV